MCVLKRFVCMRCLGMTFPVLLTAPRSSSVDVHVGLYETAMVYVGAHIAMLNLTVV